MLEGSCVVQRKGQPALTLRAGDIFVLPRGDAHVLAVTTSAKDAKPAAVRARHAYMRAFSAHSDSSPRALLGHVRMQLASTMLTRTKKSIANGAANVGYQSEAAFSKRFKELYSVAPGRFRATNGLS
ncbi:Transcriptional regulator, AraC family [Candidatus Paraburkholderia calva]|nr:Transcriptional regulator, AraC family [Candidatus Paraburkholderia calva]